jgi:hypothetical protein
MVELQPEFWDALSKISDSIFVITTVVGLILLCFRRTRDWLLGTVWRKRGEYGKLAKLSTEVQIGYFDSLLGVPTFKNSGGKSDEFIYVTRYCFVQAIANKGGRVLAYSVTCARRKFYPQLWGRALLHGPGSGSRLGKDTFADFAESQMVGGAIADLGGRRSYYAETFFQGNPGLYQRYLIGLNDAGYADTNTQDVKHLLSVGGSFGDMALDQGSETQRLSQTHRLVEFLQTLESQRFRANARPNMYAVASQDAFDLLNNPMGPDLDQIRVLYS